MRAKTHFFAGLFIATLFLTIFTLPLRTELLLLLAGVLGAIIPDFDIAVSWLAPKKIPFFHWLLRHRGMSHSVYPMLLLSLLCLVFVSWQVALTFLAGYLSHLVLDGMNYDGVDYFGFGKRVRGKTRYNGLADSLLAFLLLLLTLALLIRQLL